MKEVYRYVTHDGQEHRSDEQAFEHLDTLRDEKLGEIIDMLDKVVVLGPKAKLKLHKHLLENVDEFIDKTSSLKVILEDFTTEPL